MPKEIGNPLSWAAGALGSAGRYAASVGEAVGPSEAATEPQVRKLTLDDLRASLHLGAEDIGAFRSDVLFVCLIYPLMGAGLVALALQENLLQLLFPVLSGFALVGPVAAVGLYEMSRRRERGEPVSWTALFDVLASPKFGGIVVLSLLHVVIFMAWIMAANLIFALTLGPEPPASASAFLAAVFGTPAGWAMIVIGIGVGFLFAVAVLAMSVVSFPLLLDRDVGVVVAVVTSLRVARENPRVIAIWGAIVAGSLAIGTLPLLLGVVLILPLLGHATWHLYRRAVG